jgi:hypothetical protein
MAARQKIDVQGTEIALMVREREDYISLTGIAKYRNQMEPFAIINNWMRSRSTIEFLGLWERLSNPNFKPLEFERFRSEAGSNYFVLSPQRWIETTNAIGIIAKSGRYGGTFAHSDIAFEFASWISPEFKLYLVKEFQRLKNEEIKQLGWDLRRDLTKINYRIHTDAIKECLVPRELTRQQIGIVYATEADMLNMALFGMTSQEWKALNPDKNGNMRDYANVAQLICLSNLESINSLLIHEGLTQSDRIQKLNKTAIYQMKLLTEDSRVSKIERHEQANKDIHIDYK